MRKWISCYHQKTSGRWEFRINLVDVYFNPNNKGCAAFCVVLKSKPRVRLTMGRLTGRLGNIFRWHFASCTGRHCNCNEDWAWLLKFHILHFLYWYILAREGWLGGRWRKNGETDIGVEFNNLEQERTMCSENDISHKSNLRSHCKRQAFEKDTLVPREKSL